MKQLIVLIALLVAPLLRASDVGSHTVVIPIAGRTPGAFQSLWRTDVYVSNAARQGEPLQARVIFSRAGADEQMVSVVVPPRATVVLRDVIRETFGHEIASGLLRITTERADAKLTARARIYNVSASGQFAQTVQALPLAKLSRVALLPGLVGVDGNRTNIGVANPHAEEVALFITFLDADGELRGGYSTSVAPRSVHQVLDVFGGTSYGGEGSSIEVRSSRGVYAYASIVRRDTGDADFVAPVATELDATLDVVPPPCAAPAPLRIAAYPAEGWIVTFRATANAALDAERLAQTHGFTVKSLYVFGFHALLTPQQVAAIRCDAAVAAIDQNARVPMP